MKDLLLIIIFVLFFIALCQYDILKRLKNLGKEQKAENLKKTKDYNETEKDKIQKEIELKKLENFLNYNGEEQPPMNY